LENTDQDHDVDDPDQVEEYSGHSSSDDASDPLQQRRGIFDLPGQGTYAECQQANQSENDRRVAEGEPEAHRDRPLSFGHEFPRGVVDRGNVISVKGVPHAECVRGYTQADTEYLSRGDLI